MTGLLCWALMSAIGLTAMLAASRLAFDAVRLAGACYLLWLGLRALWTARRRAPGASEERPRPRRSGAPPSAPG
ncbi:LysE family translocator [Actinomadura luteofluorescens]|uniref:LysE family translocator n=1 Tax=Actinomadura luteofluorescens TaxID=46163 RepID=UPI003626D7E6